MTALKKRNSLTKAKKGVIIKNFSKPISAEMQTGGATKHMGIIKKSNKPPLDKKGIEALKKEMLREKAAAVQNAKRRDSIQQVKNSIGRMRK